MSELRYIIDQKEGISEKHLEQLFKLMQENRKEILLHEPPSAEYFRIFWNLPQEKSKEKKWVLVLNDEILIGYGYVSWNIMFDNLDIGYFWCFIKKEHRRKGYGTALLQQLCRLFPQQIRIVQTESFENTDGEKFVANLKEEYQSQMVISISDIRNFDKEKVSIEAKQLKQRASEKGYKIIFSNARDLAKNIDYPKYVEMVEEIWNDMPREELSDEDEILTPERHNEYLRRAMDNGYEILTFIAITKETEKPIGLTCTNINKFQPLIAYQEDTGILREHRGNGLGLTLKYQMLNKLLTETNTKYWETGNAGSNEHMLRINDKLGYKKYTSIKITEFMKEEWQNFL